MSLSYAILGTLSTAPSSGYDLARLFDTGLGWFWSAAHSQIYPELKKLEDRGLVESSSTTVGEKLEKRLYTITPAGLEELKSFTEAPPLYRPNRDPERLQFIFSDLFGAPRIREHLELHREHHATRMRQLEMMLSAIRERRHERINERLRGRPKKQQELTLKLRELAYMGDIRRAELEIEWADAALKELDGQ
jgi:DNA-binding PadR family transcriptional regulator